MTAYACREHTTETVTWRGTGCPRCEHERRFGRPVSSDYLLSGADWDRWQTEHRAVHVVEVNP